MTNDETTISNTITKKIYRQLFSSYSLIALLVIAISIFYFTFTSNDRVAGIFSDDAMYLLQAELYSPWKSEESPVLDLVRKVSRFPPLYPIVLGLMGVDSHHTVLAAQISCGILLLSIMIFGIWTWHESDQLNLTITILILLALLPSTLIMSQGLWSEFLFMCFIYSAFLCSDSKIKPGQKWLATALLIALSTLTRSIGIAIATAFILLLLLKRTKNRLVYIVSVLSPFLLWTFSRNIVQNHPSYFDDLLTISAGFSLAHIFEVMATRLATLVDSWSWLFSIVESYGIYRYLTVFVAMILFVFAVLGFFMRIKQLKLDALSIPFYLAVILIWPYQNVFFVSRFLYPLLPLFLFYMWIGIQSLPTNKKMHNLIITLWVLSIISIAYPSSRQFIDRGYKEIPSELMPYRRSRNWLLPTTNEIALKQVSFNKTIIEMLPEIAKHIPMNECVYAYQAPIIILYTHRISGIFPPYTDSTAEFENQTKACNFFLAMNITDLNNSYPPFYPQQHINEDHGYDVKQFFSDSTKDDKTSILLIRRINKNKHNN